jgi:hypothetical protein
MSISIGSRLQGALRRGAIVVALGAAALVASGVAEAHKAPRHASRPVGGIEVDVNRLLAMGLGVYAETVRGDLEAALQAEYAGGLPPGRTLLVRINGVSLNSYVGGYSLGFGNNDYLDGVAILIGPNGEELATQKILAVTPADSGGPWYVHGAERRRTAYLSTVFASWTHRYIPG